MKIIVVIPYNYPLSAISSTWICSVPDILLLAERLELLDETPIAGVKALPQPSPSAKTNEILGNKKNQHFFVWPLK